MPRRSGTRARSAPAPHIERQRCVTRDGSGGSTHQDVDGRVDVARPQLVVALHDGHVQAVDALDVAPAVLARHQALWRVRHDPAKKNM